MNRHIGQFIAGIFVTLALLAGVYQGYREYLAPSRDTRSTEAASSPPTLAATPSRPAPPEAPPQPPKPAVPTQPARLDLDDCRGEVLYTFAAPNQRIRNTGGCAFSDMHFTAPLRFEVQYCVENRNPRRCRADDPRPMTDIILVEPNNLAALAPYGIVSILPADKPSTISFKLSVPPIVPAAPLPLLVLDRSCNGQKIDMELVHGMTIENPGLCRFENLRIQGTVMVQAIDCSMPSYRNDPPARCPSDWQNSIIPPKRVPFIEGQERHIDSNVGVISFYAAPNVRGRVSFTTYK